MLDTCAFNWHQLRAPPHPPALLVLIAQASYEQKPRCFVSKLTRRFCWRPSEDGNGHPVAVNGRHRTVTAARPPPGGPLPGRWMRPSVVCYRIIFLSYPLWLRLKEPILSTDSGIIPNLKFLRIQEDSLRFLGFSASRLVTIL